MYLAVYTITVCFVVVVFFLKWGCFFFNFLGKLKFDPPPDEVYYLELDKVASIKCHAEALTPPLIRWLKLNNGPVKLPDHMYESGTLHFEKVRREDEGKYMCVATHRTQGLINTTVTVRIVGN